MSTKQQTGKALVPEHLPPEREGGSLATVGSSAMTLPQLKEVEQALDQRIQVLDRIKVIIDKRVSPDCFDKFQDDKGHTKIRRNKNYADVVAATVGASFRYLKDERGQPIFTRTNYQDDDGPYYVYECYGIAEIPGMVAMECSGAASSRDKFLSRGRKLTVAEVDERFVRQMAATECRKKGILALLGLSGDSNEAEMNRAGKDTGGISGHKFQKGTKGGSTDTQEQADIKGEITRMCIAMLEAGYEKEGEAQPTTADQVCLLITKQGKFPGWRSIKAITEKGLERTYNEVKRQHDEFMKLGEDGQEKLPI